MESVRLAIGTPLIITYGIKDFDKQPAIIFLSTKPLRLKETQSTNKFSESKEILTTINQMF